MESMTLILREAPTGDAFDELVAFCYGEIEYGKNRKDLALINDSMCRFKSAVTKQIINQLRHRTATAQTDYITNASNSLAVLKDVIFSRCKVNERLGKCTGHFRALYSGVHTIQRKIMKSWPVHSHKEKIKVDDREMGFAREGLHKQRRQCMKRLNWYVTNQQLIELALQPVKAILQGGSQGVMIAELERVQQYMVALEKVLPEVPAGSLGVMVGPRKYVDNQLLSMLKGSGYFTAAQLPQPEEEEVVEMPAEVAGKRRSRMRFNATISFIGALSRVFKEKDFIANENMSEFRRIQVDCIETASGGGTTVGALYDAYKNISDHTRKKLIAFFKDCIRWLENYTG